MSLSIIEAFLVLLLAYAGWRMPDAVHPTLPFGVRVPKEQLGHPVIGRALRTYRTVLVPLAALAILAELLAGGLDPAYSVLILVLFIALSYIDYYAAHRALQRVKRDENWYAGLRQTTAASLSGDARPARYPVFPLLAACAVIAVTAVIGALRYPALPQVIAVHFGPSGQPNGWMAKSVLSAFSPVWSQIVVTALQAGVGYAILRSRQELDPAEPRTSMEHGRSFRAIQFRLLMIMAVLMNVTLLLNALIVWGLLGRGPWAILLSLVPVLAGVAYTVLVSLRVGQGGSRLPASSAEAGTGQVHRDDDRYWFGGAVYVNRQDPAIMVQRRYGVGWTLNFGHPASWLVIAAIIALAVLPRLLRR